MPDIWFWFGSRSQLCETQPRIRLCAGNAALGAGPAYGSPSPSPAAPSLSENLKKINICFSFCFQFFGAYTRSGIGGLEVELEDYDSSMFNFLRNHHTVVHRSCIILRSYQQCTSSNFSTFLPAWYIFSHLNGYEVVSHCSSELHISSDYWCSASFMNLWAICTSSLENVLSSIFAHSFISLFFCCWVVGVLYRTVDINPLSDKQFTNTSPICLVAFALSCPLMYKFLSLMKANLFFLTCPFGVISKKLLSNTMS